MSISCVVCLFVSLSAVCLSVCVLVLVSVLLPVLVLVSVHVFAPVVVLVSVSCLGLVVPCASCFVGALLLLMSCYCGPCDVGLRHLCGYKLQLDRHVDIFSIGHLMAPGFLRGACPLGSLGRQAPRKKSRGSRGSALYRTHSFIPYTKSALRGFSNNTCAASGAPLWPVSSP